VHVRIPQATDELPGERRRQLVWGQATSGVEPLIAEVECRKHHQRRQFDVVDVELAERDAGGDDVLEALLVVVAHGDKLLPPRVAEPRPLMEEDRGVRQLPSDYAQVSLYERAKPAARAAAGRSGVGRFHEG